MAQELVGLTREAFETLRELVAGDRRSLPSQERVSRRKPDEYQWYWGKLASSMTAGTLAVPTTTTVNVWLPDASSGANPKPFIVTTDTALLALTVVNRSSMTGSTGTMVKIEFDFGEWSIKWADC